jgi:hypothetical protein
MPGPGYHEPTCGHTLCEHPTALLLGGRDQEMQSATLFNNASANERII